MLRLVGMLEEAPRIGDQRPHSVVSGHVSLTVFPRAFRSAVMWIGEQSESTLWEVDTQTIHKMDI